MNTLNCHDKRIIKKLLIHVVFVLIIFFNFSCRLLAKSASENVPVVVTSQWLEENRSAPDLVILHVSTVIQDYENGHIPGALFLWPGWLSVSTEKESTVPADLNLIKKVLGGLGVSNKSHIVLCGSYGNLVAVCRVFVTLDYIGVGGRISILEGGFDEWKAQGRKVSVSQSESRKGKVIPLIQDNLVNTEWMVHNLANKAYFIIDARPKAYYEGMTGTPRQGHIPGAHSLPATDLYDTKTFHFAPVEKLAELFLALDIPQGARPVFYCNTGNSACVDYVAAVIVGFSPILFDGSMEGWGNRFDLPITIKR